MSGTLLNPVLLTGATGRMGQVIRDGLQGDVDLRLLARRPLEWLAGRESCVVGAICDFDACVRAVDGTQAVVHLAAIADEAPFNQILQTNIVGVYNIYEAARRAGVRRVVFASSHHVFGMYEPGIRLRAEDPVRPDSYYGVSKVFGEALARLYHDKWGLESVCLRIGTFRDRPEDPRQLSVWLSGRDGVEIVRRSLTATKVGFVLAFAVSANTDRWWDFGQGEAVLGYEPLDNADDFRAEVKGPAPTRQGGRFADPTYCGGLFVPHSFGEEQPSE